MADYEQRTHTGLEVAFGADDPEVAPNDPEVAPTYPLPSKLHTEKETTHRKNQGMTCGLRNTTFWLVFALFLVVILAGIGGGIGGKIAADTSSRSPNLSSSNTSSSMPSSTAKPTNSTPTALDNVSVPKPSDVNSLALDCPKIDSTTYISRIGQSYQFVCAMDYQGNSPAAQRNGTVKDLVGLIAYSVDDCIEACSEMNEYLGGCGAITFKADMSLSVKLFRANCWLKNTSGRGIPKDNTLVSAKLLP